MGDVDRWESQLVEQVGLGVVVWILEDPADDGSLRLVHANPAAVRELAVDLLPLVGRTITEIFPSVQRERVGIYAAVCRDRQPRDIGDAVLDGRAFAILAYPVLDRGVAVIFENQSDLKQAARRERSVRQFLDSVIENIPAMVFMKDARELRFESFNRAGEELLGVPRSALIGKNDHDFFPPEQADFFIQKDREVLARRALEDIPEEPIETPRGRRWLHTRKLPLFDEDGNPEHLLGLSIDITERRMVAELRREFYVALEAENRRVVEATRVKSEFLAGMSHELRTPLNAIIGFAELMAHGQAGELTLQQRDFVGDIVKSGHHLLRLISDVLDLAKVESGQIDLHPVSADLVVLVDEVRNALRLTASEKQIGVEHDVASDVRHVVVDPGRVKQVLYNYLSNALKFTGAGGKVTIRASAEDPERFRLEVEDNGIGIAESDFAKLFINFQQLDTGANKRYAGTGLGLALTKRLVESQGGTVGVRSERGVGSVFHAVLPRKPA